MIPTHRTKDDLVKMLVQIGGVPGENVAAFPERTSDNCRKMTEVNQQYKFGIVVPSALCSTCEFQLGCPHLAEREGAEKAPHTVGTMARMENNSLARVGANRELIRIDEDSLNLLRPTVKARIAAIQKFMMAVESAIEFAAKVTVADFSACLPFLQRLQMAGAELVAAAQAENADTAVPIDIDLEPPKMLEFILKKGFERSGLEPKKGDNLAEAKKVMVGLVAGQLKRCAIQVDKDRKGNREEAVVGVWYTELPRNEDGSFSVPILLSDATADAELLRSVLGTGVIDITPTATVRHQKRVVQVPIDVKRSTTPDRFQRILRGLLVAFPEKRRVGVIGHRPHVQAIGGLGRTLRRRIIKSTYFGSGEDRASNEWLEEGLDLLLIIGTPRIPPADLRTRMIQLGLDGDAPTTTKWKKRYWRGRTETGEPIDIVTRRYSDPSWQRSYEYDVRATLRQALGRARAIMTNGIDAVVVTCEPLQLPIWDESLVEVSEAVDNAIDLLAEDGCPPNVPLWKVLSERLTIAKRTAQALASELAGLGIVEKLKRGRYIVAKTWDISSSTVINAPSAP